MNIPESFAQQMRAMHGAEGVAWLGRLPGLVAAHERLWHMRVLTETPFLLSYNYVAPAVMDDGRAAVFKAGFPGPELLSELRALQVYGGQGIAALLHYAELAGVLLLERLQPGEMLTGYFPERDAEATDIAAQVMLNLWRPLPAAHPFPDLRQWTIGIERIRPFFGGTSGPLPEAMVARAERLREELLTSSAEVMLLHGDLHHYNILSASRAPWLAIDPKGVAGERAYECAAFLHNPMGDWLYQPDAKSILRHRMDQLSERLGIPRERIAGWALVQGVLSDWWSIEDHVGETLDGIALAERVMD